MFTSRINTQQGAALLVSLIILIAMTLLGITSMKSSSTELAMAGNLRESGLTFQATEAGLRSAEAVVENSLSSAIFDGSSPSMLGEANTDPDYLNPVDWTGTTSTGLTLEGISISPQYVIKHLGLWSNNPLAQINTGGGYANKTPGDNISNFRVTSRGTGQTGNTARIVQSYYGKEY